MSKTNAVHVRFVFLWWLVLRITNGTAQTVASLSDSFVNKPLEVGFSRVSITPPVGMRLCGTFEEKRSIGIHDSLYVRAFVFRQGGVKLAIAGCDLAMISPEVGEAVRTEVASLGFPKENVLIHASETHNGPDYFGEFREVFHQRAVAEHGYDPAEPIDYSAWLTTQISRAIRVAHRQLESAELRFGQGEAEGIAFYRRYRMKDGSVGWNPGKRNPNIVAPLGPTDIRVPVLSVHRPGAATPAALLTGFAMHLATLEDRLYSADYPYYLHQALTRTVSPKVFTHFLQAPCNEVNHLDVTTDEPQMGYAWAEVVGETLARSVRQVLKERNEALLPDLRVGATTVALALQEFSESAIEKQRKIWYYADRSELPFLEVVHAARVTGIAERHRGGPVPVLIQAFQLSAETVVIGLPSEVSVELGLAIREKSPYANTIVVQLSNDWLGYIPPRRIFAEGNYEAVVAKVKAGEGERLVRATLDLVNSMKSKSH